MAASYRQASTTDSSDDANHKAKKITPATCCIIYFFSIIVTLLLPLTVIVCNLGSDKRCYLDLFAHSVSVSNADWSIDFAAKSPITGCKISLHMIKSSLLRGQEVISESPPSSDLFRNFVASYETDWPVTNLGFSKVITPEVIGDVVWNTRVEIVAAINKGAKYPNGDLIRKRYYVNNLLMVNCGDIPVKFTTDSTGNMTGTLLGNMRRCDYKVVYNSEI